MLQVIPATVMERWGSWGLADTITRRGIKPETQKLASLSPRGTRPFQPILAGHLGHHRQYDSASCIRSQCSDFTRSESHCLPHSLTGMVPRDWGDLVTEEMPTNTGIIGHDLPPCKDPKSWRSARENKNLAFQHHLWKTIERPLSNNIRKCYS